MLVSKYNIDSQYSPKLKLLRTFITVIIEANTLNVSRAEMCRRSNEKPYKNTTLTKRNEDRRRKTLTAYYCKSETISFFQKNLRRIRYDILIPKQERNHAYLLALAAFCSQKHFK